MLYTAAGCLHFLRPQIYLAIMPHWLPAHLLLVKLSGACEVFLGLLLLPVVTKKAAAWLIILLLMAVFPANVEMAINWHEEHHPFEWLSWVRLPFQPLLIWWAWTHTRA